MPLTNFKVSDHQKKHIHLVTQYLKLTEKGAHKIPDRMVASTKAVIAAMADKVKEKSIKGNNVYVGLPYSVKRTNATYLSPLRRRQSSIESTQPITHEHSEILVMVCELFHIRIMWKYVMAGDNAIKSIALVGSQNHVAAAAEFLDHYFLQLQTYRVYRRMEYHSKRHNGEDMSLFTDAKDYSSTFIKELVLICNDTIRKELENHLLNRMHPSQATLLEQWIPNAIKLDYRDYHYQTKPMYHNALSKKWHDKRFLPCEL